MELKVNIFLTVIAVISTGAFIVFAIIILKDIYKIVKKSDPKTPIKISQYETHPVSKTSLPQYETSY